MKKRLVCALNMQNHAIHVHVCSRHAVNCHMNRLKNTVLKFAEAFYVYAKCYYS